MSGNHLLYCEDWLWPPRVPLAVPRAVPKDPKDLVCNVRLGASLSTNMHTGRAGPSEVESPHARMCHACRWYRANAKNVWGGGMTAPSMQETRVHAKCLRTVSQVR
eukprot:267449-Chlamydomonas_euryale.AAC.1